MIARLRVLWRALIGGPRALWALLMLVLLKRRARAEIKALDPALHTAGQQLAKVDEGDPLVTRYCLVTVATGRKVCLEGAPGKVAIFATHSQALQKRRRGERIQRVWVPASKLEPSVVAAKRQSSRFPLAALLLAAALGCAEGVTAPRVPAAVIANDETVAAPYSPPPPAQPEMIECTGVRIDTLWVGRTPYLEIIGYCQPSDYPTPVVPDTNRAEPALRSAP